MLKQTRIAAACRLALVPAHLSTFAITASTVSLGLSLLLSPISAAHAADNPDLAQIRAEMQQLKNGYEARLQLLEEKLQQLSASASQPQNTANQLPAKVNLASLPPLPAQTIQAVQPLRTPVNPTQTAGNGFNPAVSLILGGTYANLSANPEGYKIRGFMNGGETGPGARGLNLGESELTLSANIDPQFSGKLTFALSPEDEVGVEEAFVQTSVALHGVNYKAGRFLSSIGYLNSQHAHTWDFVDAPLAYQAFLGGQYKADGVQARYLLPSDQFIEIGAEIANGAAFPGTARNKNGIGSSTLFAHMGDDIGESASWRAGISFLQTRASERSDSDSIEENTFSNSFSGKSNTMILDAIYKWAPSGNATVNSFKLQGEYFRRKETGTLTHSTSETPESFSSDYRATQSGAYLQGVYQFAPQWRFGLRHDRLFSGSPGLAADSSNYAGLSSLTSNFQPRRNSMMVDYNPSEFSRFRIQFSRDQSRSNTPDNQFFLQYIMSLGAHGAHSF